MPLTFREKSLWLQLTSLVVIFGAYFGHILPTASIDVTPDRIATFIGMLVVLVAIQIGGHVLLAFANRHELAAPVQSDERDMRIRLAGEQYSGYALVTGVFCSLCVALLVPGNFVFVHVLLAFWVAAEITGIVTRIVLYRRGL